MSAASDRIYAALSTARSLPGWTVTRLDTGAHRVTSPSGLGLVPADITTDTCEKVLAHLDELGLAHDRDHRLVPAPRPAPQPELFQPTTDTESETVPSTTKTSRARRPATFTSFNFPDEPQDIPLDNLLPKNFVGKGKILVPSVRITPEIAEAFLEFRATNRNRKLRPSNKAKFVRLIEADEFDHTHQGIAFNTELENADGGHRMAALLDVAERNPEISIVVDITYNAEPEQAVNYDGGANRSNVDRLQVAGVENASRLAPLVRLLYQYETSRETGTTNWKDIPAMPNSQLVEWSQKVGAELADAYDDIRLLLRGTFMNLNVAAVATHLAREQWEKSPILDFCEALGEPTAQGKGTPQRAMASWLRNNQTDRKRTTAQLSLAMFLVAYNDFCAENERQQMKWLPSTGMPLAYSPPAKPRRKK